MTLDIYTIGGIDILTQVYRFIVLMFGDTAFDTIVRFMITAGIIFCAIYYLMLKGDWASIGRYFLFVTLVYGALFGIKTNITITDTKYKQSYTIEKVPLMPAFIHSMTTSLKMFMIERIDSAFHTGTVVVWSSVGAPDNQFASTTAGYLNTGLGGYYDTYNVMKTLEFNKIADPDIMMYNTMLDSYLYQCFIPQMATMNQEDIIKDVSASTDLLTAIEPKVDQIINFDGISTCYELYSDIEKAWTDTIKDKVEAPGFLSNFGVSERNSAVFSAILNDTVQAGSITLSDSIGQAGIMKALNYAHVKHASATNISPSEVAQIYNAGMSTQEQVNLGKTLGKQIREYIPYLAILFEALYIGMLPFTALLILIPGNTRLVKMFFLTMVMVAMWEPTLALVNGFMTTTLIAQIHTSLAAAHTDGGLSLMSYNTIMEVSDRLESICGFTAMGVQGIVSAIIFGGEMSVMHALSNRFSSGVVSGDIAKNVAPSIQNQRFASEMGERYGAMSYYNAAQSMQTLNNLAYQRSLGSVGSRNMVEGGEGAYSYGAAVGAGHNRHLNRFGFDNVSDSTYKGSAINLSDTSGRWNAYDGDTAKVSATSFTNTKMAIGGAEFDSKAMGTGLFKSTAEWQELKQTGKVNSAIAEKYGISPDSKATWTLDDKNGLRVHSAQWQENKDGALHSYNFNGSQIVEQYSKDGIQYQKTKGMDGKVVENRAFHDLQKNENMYGMVVGAGAKVTRYFGEKEGEGRTEISGVIDGRQGTLVSQNGKLIFTESRGGKNVSDENIYRDQNIISKEDLRIDKKLREKSDIVENRKETLITDKKTEDYLNRKTTGSSVEHYDVNQNIFGRGDRYSGMLEPSAKPDDSLEIVGKIMNNARVQNTHNGLFNKDKYFDSLETSLQQYNTSLVGEGNAYENNTKSKDKRDTNAAGGRVDATAGVSFNAGVPGVGPQANAGVSTSAYANKELSQSETVSTSHNQDMTRLQSQTKGLLEKYEKGEISDSDFQQKYANVISNYSTDKLSSRDSSPAPEKSKEAKRDVFEYQGDKKGSGDGSAKNTQPKGSDQAPQTKQPVRPEIYEQPEQKGSGGGSAKNTQPKDADHVKKK